MVQTAVVMGGVAFAVLTIVGIWFRGPGMSIVWPWAGDPDCRVENPLPRLRHRPGSPRPTPRFRRQVRPASRPPGTDRDVAPAASRGGASSFGSGPCWAGPRSRAGLGHRVVPAPPAARRLFGEPVRRGPPERFEPGSVTAFPTGRFYLVRLKDGGFLALHRECTHLGCTVPWDAAQGRFACPCHASAFDITGQVLSPPAPRPLDLYAIRIENGVVKVDMRRRVPRTAFDASQVTVA